MRVLMISDFYPPIVGGMERHVQTLAREMARRGHEVAVATLWHQGSPAFEVDAGVRVYRLSGWNRALAPFYESPEHHFHPTMPDPGVVAGLRRVLAQERPQIVHARGWMLYSFLALKPRSGAKLVVTLHDCALVCPTRAYLYEGQPCTGPAYAKCVRCAASTYGPLKGFLLTTGLRMSSRLHRHIDRFIAVSSAVREASLVGTGTPPREIEVVPTFIPDNVADEARQVERPTFLPPPEEYILFVGRANVHKGLDVLLAAHQGVSQLARLVVLVTEEGGSETPSLPGVSVVRNAPHAQVMAAWQDCAVGVVPSVLPEALPQVAIEAMACGKPVIASAIGGIPDLVIDGETGLLVPAGDVDALREALRTLLTNPALRARLGAAGRERARLFTVGVVADRIERIYHEVLAEEVTPCTAPIAH